MKFRLSETKVKEPDAVELVLIGILVIWTVAAFYLLRMASTFEIESLVSWTSLTAFFVGFSSIVLIVIAILLADIRKSLG